MSFRFVNCDAIFFLKIWSKFDLNLIWPLPNRNFQSHTRNENPNPTRLSYLGLKEMTLTQKKAVFLYIFDTKTIMIRFLMV